MTVAKAIEFIQSRGHCVSAKVLTRNFLLAYHLGFGTYEFGLGQAFEPQGFSFLEQFELNQARLFRRGSGIEKEVAGTKANKVLRPYIIGETKVLADSQE